MYTNTFRIGTIYKKAFLPFFSQFGPYSVIFTLNALKIVMYGYLKINAYNSILLEIKTKLARGDIFFLSPFRVLVNWPIRKLKL